MVLNNDKSVEIFFRSKRFALSCIANCRIGDKVIKFSGSVKYLGVCIHDSITDNEDIKRQMIYLYGTANWLKTNFAKCSKRVKVFLFKAVANCTMCYPRQLWYKYSHLNMQHLKVAFNAFYCMLHGLPAILVQENFQFRMILSLILIHCFVNLCFVSLIGAENWIIH